MLEKIRDIMLDYIEVPRESITPETRFLTDLSMNSLTIVDMVAQLEDELEVVIESEDLNKIVTVQDLLDYLEEIM